MDNSLTESKVCEKCKGWGRSPESGHVCDLCGGKSVSAIFSNDEVYFSFPDYIDFDSRARREIIQKIAVLVVIIAIILFILFLSIIVRSLF